VGSVTSEPGTAGPGRRRVVTGQPPHIPEIVEDVGLAEPVTQVTVEAQGLLLGLGRGRVITGYRLHHP